MTKLNQLDEQIRDLWFQEDLKSLKKEVSGNNTKEQNESPNRVSKYKDMIEKQTGPITYWNRENPEISLTFDDGYWKDNIIHILDTLKWSWIHATFFILWDCLKQNPDLWKRAVEEGHQICCHTFSHIYLSDNNDVTDLTNGLNKNINIDLWIKNVKNLLWDEYYKKLEKDALAWFPNRIKSSLLLETEILMREAQVKQTLWEEYRQNLKDNYPFFRFPWWCGARRPENIAVLKKLWYLSIWWSDDFYDSQHGHKSVEKMEEMDIPNWAILLFHFKKNHKKWESTEREYLDSYIRNLKNKNITSKTVSDII